MIEPAGERDPRDVVGFPGNQLPRLRAAERKLAKQFLERPDLEPVIAIRVALATGAAIRQEWLRPEILDRALDPQDLPKVADKLVTTGRSISGTALFEYLVRKADRAPIQCLAALHKLFVPKQSNRPISVTVEPAGALVAFRVVIALVSTVFNDRRRRRERALQLVAIAAVLVRGPLNLEVSLSGLQFLRVFDRAVGWEVYEDTAISGKRETLLDSAAKALPILLRDNRLSEAEILATRVRGIEAAENRLQQEARRALEAPASEYSVAARSWLQRFLDPNKVVAAGSESTWGDAARERIALILLNAWEARNDGAHAAHAFDVAEEVSRNGFGVFISGNVGDNMVFDPDVHSASEGLNRGDPVELVRPWVEWRTPTDVKVLMRGQVTKSEA